MVDSTSAPSQRLLFVDDEENVISGLRRMLHGHRKKWAMSFATSGEEALRLLEGSPHDVVVADMRMPGMTGAELLQRVRERWPDTVRIILSGHSEMSSILRSVGPSHQFLSKPCDPEILEKTIQRALQRRAVLENPKLTALVGGLESVPSLPTLFTDLVAAIDREASLAEVGRIVARDIGMTTKVLQLVNSSYFGVARKIEDPGQAVGILGTEAIQALALGAGVFDAFELADSSFLKPLWARSEATAGFAQRICRFAQADAVLENQAMVGAFLHEVGWLVIAIRAPEDFQKLLAIHPDLGPDSCAAEIERLGFTHADTGGYLLGLWGLPDAIAEAVAGHHSPHASAAGPLEPLTIVHVAQALAHSKLPRDARIEDLETCGLDRDYLAAVGCLEAAEAWIEACAQSVSDD